MKYFTVYLPATGEVLRSGYCQDEDFELQVRNPAVESIIEANHMGEDVYWNGTQIVPFPPKPSEHHVWSWTDKQWRADHGVAARSVRERRNRLLAACDWTQLVDVPQATAVNWRPYRQALRDVPQQAGFPFDVTWPQSPA